MLVGHIQESATDQIVGNDDAKGNTMSAEQMRAALLKVYPGVRWSNRVKKMSDAQTFVLYTKFVEEKRI